MQGQLPDRQDPESQVKGADSDVDVAAGDGLGGVVVELLLHEDLLSLPSGRRGCTSGGVDGVAQHEQDVLLCAEGLECGDEDHEAEVSGIGGVGGVL